MAKTTTKTTKQRVEDEMRKRMGKQKYAQVELLLAEYFRTLGTVIGSAGGRARAEKLSKKRRKEIAALGAAARMESLKKRKQQAEA